MSTDDPSIDVNCMTLNRFILQEQRKFPGATGDLSHLLNSIVTAVKAISSAVRRAGMTKLFGVAGHENVTGDAVQKLDVLSNELFINMLKSSYTVCAMVSEENKEMIEVETENQGKYIVYFDPLDGSSNIDCLVSIGSIFGIAKKPDSVTGPITKEDVLLAGRHNIASGCALYGSATMLVLTCGNGVNGFTLDPSVGEFILTEPNMRIKERGKYYSINEGYSNMFDKPLQDLADTLLMLRIRTLVKECTVQDTSEVWSQTCTVPSNTVVSSCTQPPDRVRTVSCVCCTSAIRWPMWWNRPVAPQAMARRIFWMWCRMVCIAVNRYSLDLARMWRTI